MNTTFYFHPLFLEHDTGAHPENRARLETVLAYLKETYKEKLMLKKPARADIETAARVHAITYLREVEGRCLQGGGFLDVDTPVSEHSFEAALHAVGAAMESTQALIEGTIDSGLVLARPPGHHARPGAGMGFCLINHVAVAAEALKRNHGLERILIVDFDVHHGNGTQEIFYQDGAVFYLSMHRYPFYPGSGSPDETGAGPGRGTTRNLPILIGTPPAEALLKLFTALEEVMKNFKPQIILVSAGFDGYADDPIGGLGFLPDHYKIIGKAIREAADMCSHKGILSLLEGGYSLSGLPLCLTAYVEGLG